MTPSVPGSASATRTSGLRALVWVTAWVAVLITGCAGLPRDLPPPRQLLEPQPAPSLSAVDWPVRNAWDEWHEPRLLALIEQALAEQPGLQQVRLRVAQADAVLQGARAAGGLQLNASVDLTHQRFTENGLVPRPLAGSVRWNNNAQLSAGWEFDLFGRQEATIAAAVGQSRAAAAQAQAAAILLAARLADGWITLARHVEHREVTQAFIVQRRQVLDLVRQRIGAGLDTNVELRQAQSQLAQAQVELEAGEEQIARTRHALAELSGQQPQALADLTPRLAPVRAQALPESLPADLLGRRADLVAQRWRVEAALQDANVARAQFYPNINLIAFAGLSSLGLDRLLQAGSLTWGVGPAVRLPILDGGRLRANLRGKTAEADAAVEAYNAALLAALREVADEVASLQSIERQQRVQQEALQAAESAFDLARQRYRAGLGNFLIVLNADSNLLAQRRAASDLKARHLAAEVALSRAIGGGWRVGA